jgi:hypothetical protein
MVGSFSEFLSDLARDIHPEIELRVWEVVAAVYSYVNQQFTLSSTEKSLLVRLIVICSIKGRLDARREAGEGLDPSAIDTAIERWDYLTELSQSGHVRFATESINEDASGGEVINGGSDAH